MSTPTNIAAYLPMQAKARPYAPAIFLPDGRSASGKVRYVRYTYRQLDQASDDIARGLLRHGIARGTRTVLMVPPGPDFFALAFGMFKAGIVPVVVDPGIGPKAIRACLAQARPEAFIGIGLAHVARMVLGWGRGTVRTCVTVGGSVPGGGITLDAIRALGTDNAPFEMAKTELDEVAGVLFTSGSTGPPKGVVYRHGNFLAQVEAIRAMFDITPGEMSLPTFPLFALFDPALGMTTVVPDMDPRAPAKADPRLIFEAIEDFGVTTMFGSPALLNTVGRAGEAQGVKLPTLKRILAAGAPLPAATMQRWHAMLPEDAVIFPPYGATEALPVAAISSREILAETWSKTASGKGVCVGKPVPSIEARIIRITDDIVPEWRDDLELPAGQIGEICVRGPQVTTEYFEDELNTSRSKIVAHGGFYHRMGDVGYVDEQGRIWFCGRKSHRVQTEAGTMFTIPCEAVFNEHEDVFRTALVGPTVDGRVTPVLCVELEPGVTDRERVAAVLLEMAAQHEHTRAIRRVLFHPGFPVDIRHNAKIGREALTAWAQKKV